MIQSYKNVDMVLMDCYNVHRKSLLAFFLSIIIISSSYSTVYGQRVREEAPPLRERLFFGGNLGLQFGTITDIDIAPIAGLWLLPRIAIGAGPKYRFYKDSYDRTSIYGGRVYTEFVVLKDLNNIIPLGVHLGLFLHAEDEMLSLESSFWTGIPENSGRLFKNTLLGGVGISQPTGMRSSLNIMILWALNDSFDDLAYSLYGSPEVRFSFIF